MKYRIRCLIANALMRQVNNFIRKMDDCNSQIFFEQIVEFTSDKKFEDHEIHALMRDFFSEMHYVLSSVDVTRIDE